MAKIKTLLHKALPTLILGTVCSLGAFAVGIESAGDLDPFGRSQAAVDGAIAAPRGDVNGNGILDVNDAYVMLEVSGGLREASSDEIRRGDTDGDYALTEKDARSVLYRLSTL